LSFEEAKSFAAPPSARVSAVSAWLNENGITDITTSGAFGQWIGFTTTISTANALFDADFQNFTDVGGPTQLTRTLAYSIPADLQQHINLVYPTTDFVRKISGGPKFQSFKGVSKTARALAAPSSCNSTVTPACVMDLYGIPTTPATEASNKLGVSGFSEQWPQTADLKSFLEEFRPDISPSTTFTVIDIDAGEDPQSPSDAGSEANIDVQYSVGIATNVPVTFYSVGSNNPDGILGFEDIINDMLAEAAPPHVLTTSYLFDEDEFTPNLANQICDNYMTAGARGVSILFASGDGGVAGTSDASCSFFIPTFPSTCPWVTSVGAVQSVPETGAYFSAGGYSNLFSRPSYQTTALANYLTITNLTTNATYEGKFSTTGRGFPDVAAQGFNLEIVNAGETILVGGTSCSSPIFTSVIALINDRLVAAGKSPLGFLNPFLYANPGSFFDITTGSNPGCDTDGFSAAVGWDPVTGLGTPNFESLLAAALAAA